jgi:hypothetical protein
VTILDMQALKRYAEHAPGSAISLRLISDYSKGVDA